MADVNEMRVEIKLKDVLEGRMPAGAGLSPDNPLPAGRGARLLLQKTGGVPYLRQARWSYRVRKNNFPETGRVELKGADGYNQFEPVLHTPRMDGEGVSSVEVSVQVQDPRGVAADSVLLYFAKSDQRIFPKIDRANLLERLRRIREDVTALVDDLRA